MSYAENTSVSVTKTKADIEELISKAGAGQFLSGYKENMAVIGFSLGFQAGILGNSITEMKAFC